MKRKLLAGVVLFLIAAGYFLQPYVSFVLDPEFGAAMSTRTSTVHKYEPLFVVRFQK